MKGFLTRIALAGLVLFVLVGPMPVVAQENEKEDNTGTNPINFTYDARFYMENSWLEGGSLTASTFEFRWPMGKDLYNLNNERLGKFQDLGDKYAFRLKYRPLQNLSLDDPGGDPTADVHISGMGDTDLRFLAIPHANEKWGIAAGLEAHIPTATNDLLGTGRYALRPQVFAGFFGLLGKNSIFAPGYLYRFDVGGQDDRAEIDQHEVDIYLVWLLGKMRHWLIVNPSAAFDNENDKDIGVIDVEWGYTIPQLRGASIHVRPGFGFGGDKPFDVSFEFGLRFVWR